MKKSGLSLAEVFYPVERSKKIAFTLAEVFHPAEQSKRVAFTLAEVLITLGIIGVVAALTMPVLISNYRKSIVENKLKSNVSLIQNAIKLAEAENGFSEDWTCTASEGTKSAECILNYLAPQMKIIKTCIPSNKECWTAPKSLDGTKGYVGYHPSFISALLSNGSSICMWTAGEPNILNTQIWIDIDGPQQGKNMLGADVFGIKFNLQNHMDYKKGVYMIGFENLTASSLEELTNGEFACSKDTTGVYAGRFCGALIQYNSWKIPKDYPVKF